ncbi:sugar ABC transporter substrate-binding protein [Peribacillus cavernae]|uniref:Sugar ABC transporter substrate-binding protein n=1 Tax=Peribacillus cavernae TaxID=1674310 RepID=A0A433HFM3_9BACI|nr:substrate-binding domain-containing protein [Peribacillus cavernae]MDQ0219427.1 ribose transport system substrate-binding protein [Peribacillus cavernae]RUQ27147.1 sugar ABC transporter substrate-binding protein [Peribacillus cavernae]
MKKQLIYSLMASSVLATGLLAGCADVTEKSSKTVEAEKSSKEGMEKLKPLKEEEVLGKAASVESLELTPAEIEKIKKMKPFIGYSVHFGDIASEKVIGQAIKETVESFGGKYVLVDAQRNLNKQISDVESLILKKVKGVVAIGVDTAAFGPAVKSLNNANIPVVLGGGPPNQGEFVSLVDPDGYGGGFEAGKALIKELKKRGIKSKSLATVGLRSYILTCEQRVRGFEDSVREEGYKIVARGQADTADQAQQEFENIMTANPDIVGAFGVYETPALGMEAAVRSSGRDDVLIVTHDLSEHLAQGMKNGGKLVVFTSSQDLYAEGKYKTLALLKELAGGEVPKYVTVPTLPTSPENVDEVYDKVFFNKQ